MNRIVGPLFWILLAVLEGSSQLPTPHPVPPGWGPAHALPSYTRSKNFRFFGLFHAVCETPRAVSANFPINSSIRTAGTTTSAFLDPDPSQMLERYWVRGFSSTHPTVFQYGNFLVFETNEASLRRAGPSCAALPQETIGLGLQAIVHLERHLDFEAGADFIDRYSDGRFSDINWTPATNTFGNVINTEPTIRDRAGYYDDSGPERIYLFTNSGLREATKGFDFKRVLKALEDAVALVKTGSDQKSVPTRTPDNRLVRLYWINPQKLN